MMRLPVLWFVGWLLLASTSVTADSEFKKSLEPIVVASSCSKQIDTETQSALVDSTRNDTAGAHLDTCGAPQSETDSSSKTTTATTNDAPKKIIELEEEKRRKDMEEFWKPRATDYLELEKNDSEDDDEDDEDFDDDDEDWDGEDWEEDYDYDDDVFYDSSGYEIQSPQTLRPNVDDRDVPQIVRKLSDDDDYDDDEYDDDDDDEDYYDEDDDDEELSDDIEYYNGSEFGEPQLMETAQVAQLVQDARDYMQNTVMVDETYSQVRHICKNKENLCALWAHLGECQANPAYMNMSCAPMCRTCELLHISARCPLDPNAVDALYPGDLDKMFERIATDPYYQRFKPIVLSRPDFAPGDTEETADYQLGMWVVQLDNLATPEECDRLVELGAIQGYERSSDVGAELEDGTHAEDVNEGRTSTNAWCYEECEKDPLVASLLGKMENVTGIVHTNAEFLQLLRYEVGQLYQTHNDFIPYQLSRPTGVRILTFYIYLSDVEEGGETAFPRLGLEVQPKKGRAVLWPNVFNEFPNRNDIRSDHQAKPVIRGLKYGANAWYHMRDVKSEPMHGMCL